ncbi:hypothetical protein GBA52_022456 [Prunus armeniaca]|nr:hypothetical protein GBA52_022456 [Prunus armeniaca]
MIHLFFPFLNNLINGSCRCKLPSSLGQLIASHHLCNLAHRDDDDGLSCGEHWVIGPYHAFKGLRLLGRP